VLNRDPDAHKKFLKPSPVASDLVNRCIECGFCESNCPSRDVTLTPRQRIVAFKEIARLKGLPSRTETEEARCVCCVMKHVLVLAGEEEGGSWFFSCAFC
jgi:D-lactate dehydrogenase